MFGWLRQPVRVLLRLARVGRTGRDQPPPRLGPKSEHAARAFLERAGFSILAANYRCPLGELDLVAREANTLVFVEVKSRSKGKDAGPRPPVSASRRPRVPASSSTRPEQAVTRSKQKRIGRAARYFCKSHRCMNAKVRFDVIAVEWPPDGDPIIRHHIAAFRPE